MSYGVDLLDMYVRSAFQMDRILRGAHPREMPIQVPAKFEFVINRKTAEALGSRFRKPCCCAPTR